MMNIREATKEDIPQILPVWRELMEFHAERDAIFTTCEGAEEAFSNYLADNIEKEDAMVFVADDAGTIVSYCLCMIAEKPPVLDTKRQYGNLSDLAVLETHRRNGVGERMVERAMEWFRERKMERVEVRVAVTNEVSTRFWRKMGFLTYLETMRKPVVPERA